MQNHPLSTTQEEEDPLPTKTAALHLLCGRIAAGKSTLARSLAKRHKAILISEDESLAQLYPSEINTFDDFLKYSKRFRQLIRPQCIQLLKRGTNVVLDFQANTVNSRQWFKDIVCEANARHQLHYLTTPIAQCRLQLEQRLSERTVSSVENVGNNQIALEQFDEINRYFVPPSVSEGFNVEVYR